MAIKVLKCKWVDTDRTDGINDELINKYPGTTGPHLKTQKILMILEGGCLYEARSSRTRKTGIVSHCDRECL